LTTGSEVRAEAKTYDLGRVWMSLNFIRNN